MSNTDTSYKTKFSQIFPDFKEHISQKIYNSQNFNLCLNKISNFPVT